MSKNMEIDPDTVRGVLHGPLRGLSPTGQNLRNPRESLDTGPGEVSVLSNCQGR